MPDEFVCNLSLPCSGLSTTDFWRIVEGGFHFGHSTVLYQRDRVLYVGLFDVDQRRRHDIDLWLRVIAGHTWSYDTIKGAGYREGVPESISKNRAECDYYYLRALVKNAGSRPQAELRSHLARQARRAMGIAFVDGPPDHLARIRGLGWRHLSPLYRTLYTVAGIWPGAARRIIGTKRAVLRALSERRTRAGGS